ncbi:MAG: YhcH/YjgK/YiaL family protein [Prolixibacteraceae bacterium]
MILGSLKNTETTEKLHPLFKKAFDYLKAVDMAALPADGTKIELDGNRLFLFVSEYQGKKQEDTKAEAHQRYIDIQVPIKGVELMGWKGLSQCNEIQMPYNPEKDLIFYGDAVSSYVQVSPGEFAVFFPEDVHAPSIGFGTIKKAVVKVLV